MLTEATPYLKEGSLAGVFLGDELCCGGVPLSNLTAVADIVKAHLNTTGGLVYVNECSYPFREHYIGSMPQVPNSIDIISIDQYVRGPNQSLGYRESEASLVKALYDADLYPRMSSHQRVMLIPGTFAAYDNTTTGPVPMPTVAQQAEVIAKLDAYYALALADARVIGINCFHWQTLCGRKGCTPTGGPTQPAYRKIFYGVDRMPLVVARLNNISHAIRSSVRLKTDEAYSTVGYTLARTLPMGFDTGNVFDCAVDESVLLTATKLMKSNSSSYEPRRNVIT
jgi:hypothetical protein